MQFKSFVSSALLLGTVALSPMVSINETAAQASTKKPYCTVASNQGAYFWTWTQSTIKQSCKTARGKVKATGQNVNRLWRGYYKTKALNKGKLSCIQGKKDVIGSGKLVFENGINMANRLKWNGCIFRVTN